MRRSAFGQFEGADFENRCYTGIYGGHLPHFRVESLVFMFLNQTNEKTVLSKDNKHLKVD